jgi:hypothetical protein
VTDFDILSRIRKLELETSRLKDRLAEIEGSQRRYLDATECKRKPEYSPTMEECYGAMIHAMRPREDRKD